MSEDLQRAQQRLQLDQLDGRIAELDGKAVTRAERLALLDLRIEQVGARLALAQQDGAPAIEGKVLRCKGESWTAEREAAFARLIKAIGGYVPGGGKPGDVLDFDAPHFERAVQLVEGTAEPDGDAERKALERWRAKHGS